MINNKNRPWRGTWTSVAAAALLAGLLAGCADQSGKSPAGTDKNNSPASPAPSSTASPDAAAEPLFDISMMNVYYSGDAPNMNDNPYIKAVEDYTHTKLDITWVPNAAYNDKFNVTLASGELPDVLLALTNRSTVLLDGYRNDQFWEIGPYIDEFPNLKKMNKAVFDTISVDGKIYGLFRSRDLARSGIMYRKDWADKLGLKEPQTIDDLYEMIKAFTLQDPDGNGKNDTYGLAEEKAISGFGNLVVNYGGPSSYRLQDGKFIPAHMTDEHLDALKFYRRLIEEKLINPDFLLLTDSQKRDLITTGKAGVLFGSMNIVTLLQEAGEKLNPGFRMDVVNSVAGPKGEFAKGDSGFTGLFLFPKSSVKTEADLKRILGFFDKLGDEKMQNLIEYGIEGTDYKLEEGKVVKLDTARKDFPLYMPQLKVDNGDLIAEQKDANPLELKWKALTKANERIAVTNPAANIIVDQKVTQAVSQTIADMGLKFMMGEADEAAWNKTVEDWRKNGGDDLLQAMDEAYADTGKP